MSEFIIIAGGTSSGKTTFAFKLKELLEERALIISQDNYYKDLPDKSEEELKVYNFDLPSSFDHDIMIKDIEKLMTGEEVEEVEYDFQTHRRILTGKKIKPADFIILEGIYALQYKELNKIAKLKIFIDLEDDLRLIRRLNRDVMERGMDLQTIVAQYLSTVKPMHDRFIKDTIKNADLIINTEYDMEKKIELINRMLN
ncbi:MAG: uridine kinase [Candidatus Delongbacteria bacterium]|nr:uridine kinase [Candidatus Delongbacteria bacterium]